MTRPERMRIRCEDGTLQTLSSGVTAFDTYTNVGHGGATLILGLGPDPAVAVTLTGGTASEAGAETGIRPSAGTGIRPVPDVLYMECPEFTLQMPRSWHTALPPHWRRLAPTDLASALGGTTAKAPAGGPDRTGERDGVGRIIVYRQNLRLFPSFWGPLLGRVMASRLAPARHEAASDTVVLPGTESSLLLPELMTAFSEEGFAPLRMAPSDMARELPRLLADERPALFLSVNLQGLDAAGERFHLLQACGVPVAIWCVDNPWHLLSALRTPWWREAHLCVTDASFIPSLTAHGARHVLHLPLAASPAHFTPPPACGRTPSPSMTAPATTAPLREGDASPRAAGTPPAPATPSPALAPVLFVGRSRFPDRDRFFAGCRVPPEDMEAAQAMLRQGAPHELPDFHWWVRRLGTSPLWPGKTVRNAGHAAETCALKRRVLCLAAAQEAGLTVVGDAAWRDHLPHLDDLRPPVDYYGSLPAYYRNARWTLNVTSLLLPAGLTQRHFDVWMAGGFCITDATPGLAVFPPDLGSAVSFVNAEDLPLLLRRLEADPALREDLADAWRTCILGAHTYRHRVRTLLTNVGAA